MNNYNRRKPSGGTHFLSDHVKLEQPSRHNSRSLSVDSNTSNESANSEDQPWRERDDEERESIDEDMYTTKAYRVEHDYLKIKSKGKSPSKVAKVPMPRGSSSDNYRDVDHSQSKNISSSKTKEVDLSVYLRSKNAKSMKNRHVSRTSQRNRKYIENSMWHHGDSDDVSVEQDSSVLFNKSPSGKSVTSHSQDVMSTPIKNNHEVDDMSAKRPSHFPKDTMSTPTHNAIDKKHPSSKTITTKKRPTSSGIGHIMKNIGVKGMPAHHHHGKTKTVAPSTPRLVRTPSAQTAAATATAATHRLPSPQTQTHSQPVLPLSHSSFPSTLTSPRPTSDASSFTSPRPMSSASSPFIQKFDSNILRTPTPMTPSSSTPTSRASALSPPPPQPPLPPPTISPSGSVSLNLMPQLGEGVTRAIFRALFGADNTLRSGGGPHASGDSVPVAEIVPPPRWDDSDEEDDEEVDEHCLGPELSHCKDIDLVDEKWLTDLIKSRSNSRSSSLDLAYRDRDRESDQSSPHHSEAGTHHKNIRTPHTTPLISPAAFEDALKKNLSTSTTSGASGSTLKGSATSARAAVTAIASLVVCKQSDVSDIVIPSPTSSLQLHHKFSSHEPVSHFLKAVTTDSILQRYITPTLITQLVLQLPHDDDRLSSPRLSVLKALYKNSPSLRTSISHALVVAAHSRFLRCEESRRNARRQGSDVNEASLATHCTHISGFDGKPKSNPFTTTARSGIDAPKKEESPGTLVRDHDSSLVELTLFILITECSPPLTSPPLSPVLSPATSTHKAMADRDGTHCHTLSKIAQPSTLSQGSYEVVVSIVTNVLRCYGSRLGKSAGSVEQPGIIKGIFKIVDILMTNKVDSVNGKVAVNVLLRRIVQRWPQGNHVQEGAYLKLCAHILVHCRPAMTHAAPVTAAPAASLAVTDTGSGTVPRICLSRVLQHTSRSKDTSGSAIQKTLKKLVECMASAHFKVASQAIQIVMQLNILHPHFISNPYPWSRAPLTFAALSSSEEGAADEDPTAVEALVEVLRENRGHWHPQVRHLSEEALDNLLDYL